MDVGCHTQKGAISERWQSKWEDPRVVRAQGSNGKLCRPTITERLPGTVPSVSRVLTHRTTPPHSKAGAAPLSSTDCGNRGTGMGKAHAAREQARYSGPLLDSFLQCTASTGSGRVVEFMGRE